MGNSQSSIEKIGSAVDEGIKIYKAIKQQQDFQQHSSSYQQQYHQEHSYKHQQHYAGALSDDGDSPEYDRLRELAKHEAEQRNACYERSKAAYQAGDGAEAKSLSVQGHKHDEAMKRYNQQAADLVFEEKNRGRSPYEIDLHGLFVKEAAEKVDEALRRCQKDGQDHLIIIVGKGLHSPGQIAKLKPAIVEMVKKYNVSCQPNIPNPGCLYVEFGKGTGDLSWLDVFSETMSKECIIM
ncbi:hypothetical protein BX666DRAFT_1978639 [Dichotomocladium elegans]|nr:hypothetical protein BX666DRAFT_1978639 [Dichotomocladium elegans]